MVTFKSVFPLVKISQKKKLLTSRMTFQINTDVVEPFSEQ